MPHLDVLLVDAPPRYAPIEPFPQPAGAECVFAGRTRDEVHPEHGPLRALEYEAYAPMALAVLRRLADEAVSRWGCLAVRVHHAVGTIAPGEASVIVQVVCAHRAEAFDACRYLVDELKANAPIWKRERWHGADTWSRGVTPGEADQNAVGAGHGRSS